MVLSRNRVKNGSLISPMDVFLSNAWRAEGVGICICIIHGQDGTSSGEGAEILGGGGRGSMRWYVSVRSRDGSQPSVGTGNR